MYYVEYALDKKANSVDTSSLILFLKNGPPPSSFSFIIVLSNKHYNFYNNNM